MTRPDRLSDIWSRFGRGTSARLTGASVAHTARPAPADAPRDAAPRHGRAASHAADRSAAAPDPVAAAAQALRASMSARGRRAAPPAAPAPTAPDDPIIAQVLSDMKATEARVARRPIDYLGYAASMQAGGRRRRRFLGLF